MVTLIWTVHARSWAKTSARSATTDGATLVLTGRKARQDLPRTLTSAVNPPWTVCQVKTVNVSQIDMFDLLVCCGMVPFVCSQALFER